MVVNDDYKLITTTLERIWVLMDVAIRTIIMWRGRMRSVEQDEYGKHEKNKKYFKKEF